MDSWMDSFPEMFQPVTELHNGEIPFYGSDGIAEWSALSVQCRFTLNTVTSLEWKDPGSISGTGYVKQEDSYASLIFRVNAEEDTGPWSTDSWNPNFRNQIQLVSSESSWGGRDRENVRSLMWFH